MIQSGFRAYSHKQGGFTLAEMLIAMAITTLIGAAVATLTYQTIKVNSLSSNHQTAIVQVQNGVNSLSRDAEQAQQVVPQSSTNNPLPLDSLPIGSTKISFNLITGNKLVIKWVDWNNNAHQVTYVVDGSGNLSQNNLIVARNITVAAGSWDTYSKTLSFQLQSTVGAHNTATETRNFQIIPRPAQ